MLRRQGESKSRGVGLRIYLLSKAKNGTRIGEQKKEKKKSLEDGLMYCPDGSVITPLAPCWQINGREPIYKICMPFFVLLQFFIRFSFFI